MGIYLSGKNSLFFQILIKDRLSTRNILKWKNMHLDSYNRALCSLQVEESADHLSLYSPFASSSWNLLNITILAQASFLDIVSYLEDQLNSIFFMNAIVLMCWTVWSARNDKIFQGLQVPVQFPKFCKIFQDSLSYRIFGRIHEALNINKK